MSALSSCANQLCQSAKMCKQCLVLTVDSTATGLSATGLSATGLALTIQASKWLSIDYVPLQHRACFALTDCGVRSAQMYRPGVAILRYSARYTSAEADLRPPTCREMLGLTRNMFQIFTADQAPSSSLDKLIAQTLPTEAISFMSRDGQKMRVIFHGGKPKTLTSILHYINSSQNKRGP